MNPLILAFGFANLAILGWLGAAAAPILIHLWMKRVRKETRWAAIRFLQAAIKRHARRLQLQHWILLAIRTAIILLVVLAASKPMLDSLPLAGPGVRTHRLLVLDASMSMGWQAEDGRLLERAKKLAGELIDQSRAGDVFSVCVLSSPPRTVLGQPTPDRGRARQAVQKIELTDGAADLAAGLTLVRQTLDQSEAIAERIDRHEVTFFTDLAANTWGKLAGEGGDSAAGAASGAAKLYAALIDDAMLSVVDVGEPGAANAAVVDVRLEETHPTTQRPTGVRARVARFDQELIEQRVDLVVDGITVASKTARFNDSDTASVSFSHRLTTPGVHELSVRIPKDKLPADDQRWIACNVVDHLRVLCIEGRRGAARYVAGALNPSGDADAAIQAEVVSDAALAAVDFDKYPCVFFCNVAQMSRNEAQRLNRYVRGGGGAVFFLGDRVQPERYNELLGTTRADVAMRIQYGNPEPTVVHVPAVLFNRVSNTTEGESLKALLPIQIGPAVSDPQFRLDPLDYAHPIAAPFRGRERAGLITTPVARYYKLLIDKNSSTQVALATTGGAPLIATMAVDRGRVAVVATDGSLTSIDPATGEPWTAMPAWPSFLPIVRGLLHFATGQPNHDVLVGQPIAGVLPARTAAENLVIRRPRGQQESISTEPQSDKAAWSYARTDRSGVYQLASVEDPAPVDAIAVNFDPRESDPRRIAASMLPAELSLRSVAADARGATELVAPAGIHRGLLLAALTLVLLETFLAYWFGRSAA